MKRQPPAIPRWLASRLLRGDAREVIVGDLDEAFAQRVSGGMPHPAAARVYWREAAASVAAVHAFRNPGGEAMSFSRLFQGLALDVRYVTRGLLASRGFTAIAILSLAIGIGATTALTNVARTLLVAELPVERPAELSWVYWYSDLEMRATQFGSYGYRGEGRSYDSNYSYPLYRAIKASTGEEVEMAGFNLLNRINVAVAAQPAVAAAGLIVDGDFFQTLRLPVARGRGIVPADDVDGAPPVVVIADSFWRRTFGGDARAIGTVLHINGSPFEIVGITSPQFDGLSRAGIAPPTDVIVPMSAQPSVAPSWTGKMALHEDFSRQWVRIVARVGGGDRRRSLLASAASAALRQTLAPVVPDANRTRTIEVRLVPANRGLDTLNASTSQPLAVLTGVCVIFLVVTCTNLAGMLTARGLARRRELAVRRALGAERWRLVRQALVESVVLAIIGGAAGTLLAAWSGHALAAMLSDGLHATDVRLPTDWPLLAIAAGVTLATALVFGIGPAIRLTRGEATTELRNRAAHGAARQRGGRVLIAVQLAVTVPLIVGALLFLRTMKNFSAVDLGFDSQALVLFEINPVRKVSQLDTSAPPSAAETDRVKTMLARLEAIPGVTSSTVMENALLTGWSSNTEAQVDGSRARMQMQAVGPRFFETMGMRMVAGRAIAATDVSGRPNVAVINETAARRYFPGGPAVGRTFTVGGFTRGFSRTIEVVGVVADARYESLRRETAPTFYDSYLQRPGGTYTTFFALRTAVPPATLDRSIRETIAAVDRSLPNVHLETQQQKIERALGPERVLSRLHTVFGGFALLLASLGLHGLTSYSVERRTSEIGIRIALGAQRSQVLWMILRQVLVLAGAGLALGLPLAWAAGPLVASYLFGVPPRDVAAIALSAGVLTMVALVAGWLPARRAARMDPLGALRVE